MTKKHSYTSSCNFPDILEIQADIEEAEKDTLLCEEKNFDLRIDAIDFIEFRVIGRIESQLLKTTSHDQLISLKYRAERLLLKLEEINSSLFQKLQTNIRTGAYTGTAFKNQVKEYVNFNSDANNQQDEPGYDNLDIFINGLFPLQQLPEQTKDLEPEMVYYQKTPARIVFELAKKVHFAEEDIFFDLGSGLGQVAVLVNLLTGVAAKGIEFESAFCSYARDCVTKLNLAHVTFINTDARKANYSEGTVFFMFTPFKGEILQEVLALLRIESQKRKIRIITYGPCTATVAMQSWLYSSTVNDDHIYKLAVFESF